MCKRNQSSLSYASFDVADFERRRLRLQELLNAEIQRRGIALPEPKSEPLALPMPSRKIEPDTNQDIIDADFEEHRPRTTKLRAFRTLLGSLAFMGSVIACAVILKLS